MYRAFKIALFGGCALSLVAALAFVLAPAARVAAAGGGFEVVADGLNNPRHLLFDENGALYVAEAGVGGDACTSPLPGDPTQFCRGQSGSVSRIADGAQSRVVENLWSSAIIREGQPPEIVGPQDLDWWDGQMHIVVGLGADPANRELLFGDDGINFGQIVHVDENGNWTNDVDVAAYEGDANPDGGPVDSNPYALQVLGKSLFVADAGGNDLLEVGHDGSISTAAVFPPIMGPPPGGGDDIPGEAVPTSVIEHDGQLMVGQLTGFPFPVDGASVYSVTPGEAPTVYASGFTNITAIDTDAEGNLYVLEMFANGILSGDLTSAVYRVPAGGGEAELVHMVPCSLAPPVNEMQLCAATGLTVGPDGWLYISNYGVFASGIPNQPAGQVVRLDPSQPTAITLDSIEASSSRGVSGALAVIAFALSAGLLVALRRR